MKFRTGDRVRIKETTLAEMKAGFPDRPELYSSWEGELIVEQILSNQWCCNEHWRCSLCGAAYGIRHHNGS